MWSAIYTDRNHREGHLSGIQQTRELKGEVNSPFILDIAKFRSRHSSAEATYPDEQHLGGLDEEPEHSLVNMRLTNPNATSRAGRRAPRPVKKLRDGFPYLSFPTGITKKIAANFARSLGSKSQVIDKETLEAITEASDQYFQQLSHDLDVFAKHAGRKTIDESDVITVMRR